MKNIGMPIEDTPWFNYERNFDVLFDDALRDPARCEDIIKYWQENLPNASAEAQMQIFMQVSQCLRMANCVATIWGWLSKVSSNADAEARDAIRIAFLEQLLEPPISEEQLPLVWRTANEPGAGWILEIVYKNHPDMYVAHERLFKRSSAQTIDPI